MFAKKKLQKIYLCQRNKFRQGNEGGCVHKKYRVIARRGAKQPDVAIPYGGAGQFLPLFVPEPPGDRHVGPVGPPRNDKFFFTFIETAPRIVPWRLWVQLRLPFW